MKMILRRLFNEKNMETGVIITVPLNKITSDREKANIEFNIINYASQTLYPDLPLCLYSNIYSDNPSITVIKHINRLPEETHNI